MEYGKQKSSAIRPSLLAMIDEIYQYDLGNVTKAGLIQSLKEFEAELKKLKE
jgi:hypothetical protein